MHVDLFVMHAAQDSATVNLNAVENIIYSEIQLVKKG